MQRIEVLDYEDLRGLVDYDALNAFHRQSLNPEHPTNRGNNVNPDICFQSKEGANVKSALVLDTVQHYMDEINALTGRDYQLLRRSGRGSGHCCDVLGLGSGQGNCGLPQCSRP